jgi:hypothetical protein
MNILVRQTQNPNLANNTRFTAHRTEQMSEWVAVHAREDGLTIKLNVGDSHASGSGTILLDILERSELIALQAQIEIALNLMKGDK